MSFQAADVEVCALVARVLAVEGPWATAGGRRSAYMDDHAADAGAQAVWPASAMIPAAGLASSLEQAVLLGH